MAAYRVDDYEKDTPKWVELLMTIEKQRKGRMPLTLTNYSNLSVPQVAAESCIEVGGALYGFDDDEDIGESLENEKTNYIYLDTVTLTFKWTDTPPIWSEDKQGWYDETEFYRYIGGCYFDDPNYHNKWIYLGRSRIMTFDIRDDAVHAQKIYGLTGSGAVDADNIPVSATKRWLTTIAQTIEGKKNFDDGFIVENRTDDPGGSVNGQLWFRTDV